MYQNHKESSCQSSWDSGCTYVFASSKENAFNNVAVEPSEQVAKVNKNKNGDYTCWYCDCIDIEDYTCYCPMCGRKLSRVD